MVTDTLGLRIVVLVTAVSLQDSDGGQLVLHRARMAMPSIVVVWADGGYAGKLMAFAQYYMSIPAQIVKEDRQALRLRGLSPPLGRQSHPVLADDPPTGPSTRTTTMATKHRRMTTFPAPTQRLWCRV